MRKYTYRQYGFTIVELLVVVTVIGVLASIALIGVSGAQVQARNSQTATVIQAYKKALIAYLNDNGDYPITGGSCLGMGYTDITGDGIGDCWHLNGPSRENATLLNAIKPYMNNELPLPNTTVLPYAAYNQVGAIINYSTTTTLDGVPHKWLLAYTMEGNKTKCPVGPVLTINGWPNFLSTPPATGYTESYGTTGTGCWVAMPDPTDL